MHQLQRLRDRADMLAGASLDISALWPHRATVDAILSTVEERAGRAGDLVVIDGTSQTEPVNRELVIGLRTLASRHLLAIVITSKTMWPSDSGANQPEIDDLVERDALTDLLDVIVTLHRPDLHDPNSLRPGEADLWIAKNRYGPPRRVTAAFQGHYGRFVDTAT